MAKILHIGVEAVEVLAAVRSPQGALGTAVVREREEVIEVASPDRLGPGVGGEALAGVLADGLQHRQPCAPVRLPDACQQALGDQPVHRVEGRARTPDRALARAPQTG